MKKKYKVKLRIIGLLLIFSIFLAISYLYYKNNYLESAVVVVQDGLSINYLNGNTIRYSGQETSYVISVTNNTEEKISYSLQVKDIASNQENLLYSLVEKTNKVNFDHVPFPSLEAYLFSYIDIEPHETHTYTLILYDNSHASLKAELEVSREQEEQDYFAATILNDNQVQNNAKTKLGENVATENEGLIETTDDFGSAYYFRGQVPNNYVSFASLTWRIVKINGDKTVKLVLDDYIEETSNYYNTDSTASIEEKLNYTQGNMLETLKNWYDIYLNSYERYIVNSKYCIDDSVAEMINNTTYYLGYSRLLTDYNPVANCLGDRFNAKIGLLTADEAVYAGASKNSANTAYYLYTPGKNTSFWTLTPASNDGNEIHFFEIGENGSLKTESVGSYYRGLKPVINIMKRTYVTGSGTEEDPYVIETDK